MVLKPLSLLSEKYDISFTITSSVKPHEDDNIYRQNKSNFEANNFSRLKIVEFHKKLTKKYSALRFLLDLYPVIKYSIYEARNCDIIHCRSYGGAMIGAIASFVTGIPYIFDMRGTLPEEMLDLGQLTTSSIKYKILKKLERLLISKSAYVFTVSDAFNKYIKFVFNKETCININNPTDFDIFQIDHNPNGRVNFIYSGSMLPWHKPELTIQYFYEIQKLFPSKVFFYFCTNDPDRAENIFETYGVPKNSYEINTVPFNEMPLYYKKANIAFHFIENSFSKSVCFPVKLSEYIAAELFILANDGIGDVSNIIRKYNCGLVFSDMSKINENVSHISDVIKQMLSSNGRIYKRDDLEFLNWRTEGIRKIYNVYKELAAK